MAVVATATYLIIAVPSASTSAQRSPRATASASAGATLPAGAGGATATATDVPSAPPTPEPTPLSGADAGGPALVPLSDSNGPADVAALLFPARSGGVSCGSDHDTYATDCPVTHRLAARLNQLYQQGTPYEPLCRCGRAWLKVSFQSAAAVGHSDTQPYAGEAALFTFSNGEETLTVVVARTVSGWLADDTYCKQDATTSVYSTQAPPCGPAG